MPSAKTAAQAHVYRGTDRNLARLARVLREGGLVAVPTETVYGLAGDALNPAACRRIFKAKGRPSTDPLIVHIHTLAQLHELAVTNQAVEKVARAFWPGPLTLVLPKKPAVPDLVTSGRPSVAIRMPAHPLFLKLLRACGRPLAAPSANPFGYISPTSASHVRENLGTRIRHILNGGESAIGLESTILDLRDPLKPALLRPGAISAQAISAVVGRRVRVATWKSKAPKAASRAAQATAGELAPGMLSKHYSPRTPITLHPRLNAQVLKRIPDDEAALFIFKPPTLGGVKRTTAAAGNVFWLAERGNLPGAARRLFGLLRALDDGRWKRIHAEHASGRDGLALAINDRLTRAAAKG